MTDIITISGTTYRKHHTAYCRRYESRRGSGHLEPYKGRFGTGYRLISPNWGSTVYSYVTYYVAD